MGTQIPDAVFDFFAAEPAGPMLTFAREASDSRDALREPLEAFLSGFTRDDVSEAQASSEFQFFAAISRTRIERRGSGLGNVSRAPKLRAVDSKRSEKNRVACGPGLMRYQPWRTLSSAMTTWFPFPLSALMGQD
jgi:hypothetical protein